MIVDLSLIMFWFFGVIAVASALICVTRANPVQSAIALIATMGALAALFVLLDAHLLATLQVLVYAGAIMVLFLFVIMLLNLGHRPVTDIRGPIGKVIAAVFGTALLVQIFAVSRIRPDAALTLPERAVESMQIESGTISPIADELFTTYLVPFEITGILLLAALVGAVILAKRRL